MIYIVLSKYNECNIRPKYYLRNFKNATEALVNTYKAIVGMRTL